MLSDIVRIRRRFQRSIRIDSDITQNAIEGFVCPPSAAAALLNMAGQVRDSAQGAFTWTGPYGCGKSSLVVVLGALIGTDANLRAAARAALGGDLATEIGSALGVGTAGWRVLPVVGRREDPETVIAQAVDDAEWGRRRRSGKGGDDVVARLARAAGDPSASGLLVFIDEMGKFLEHAAAGGDVYFFQRLAEAASHSGRRLIVVGVLHQAFDDYAGRLSGESRDEWLKIQGRFTDIPINVAGEEQVELIARAIDAPDRPAGDRIHAEAIADAIRGTRPGTAAGLGERLHQCWPLHPVVASLLGPMSRRSFGQNQRSVFGFLNSAEPYGFQEYLRTAPGEGEIRTYGTVEFWDYLRANLEPSILASFDGHRWSLAVEAVERCAARGGGAEHMAVVKTVALIDLFKERSGLLPTSSVIAHALPQLAAPRVEGVLSDLKGWSVLIFRKHLDAYAIYAGSDFDIDAAVATARAQMTGLDLGRLRSLAMLQPILAKAHHHKTGALRWFDINLAPVADAVDVVRSYQPKTGASGLFLLLIGMKAEAEQTVKKMWRRAAEAAGDWPVAVGWTRYSASIRESAAELMALETVRASSPELNGDSVARREVNARIARAAAEVEDLLRRAFADADWAWRQEGEDGLKTRTTANVRSLSIIASELADGLYKYGPRLHNELLNRIKPSSNAVQAQKELLRAMVMNSSQHRLGFEQWPAPAGMYASLVDRTGLHREDPERSGHYRFVTPPDGDDAGLWRLWVAADDLFKEKGAAGADLGILYDLWRRPPYGVRDGLLPVLSIAYYLSRTEQLAVYLDGSFQSKLSPLLIDRLTQEAESVRLRWTETTEFHGRVLAGVADIVAGYGGMEPDQVQPSTFEVAKGLVTVVVGLKPWIRRTQRLSPVALKVRNLAMLASDPNRFMLDDLPSVFLEGGQTPSDANSLITLVRDGLKEIVEAYPRLLRQLEAVMIRELRLPDASTASLARLRARAEVVKNLNGILRFDAFATRLAGYTGQEDEIEGIASLAASKAARDWVDRDIDNAMVEIAVLAREFLKAESLAHVKGRPDGRLSMSIVIGNPDLPSPLTPDFDIEIDQKPVVEQLAADLRMVVERAGVDRDLALAAVALLGCHLAEENLAPRLPAVVPAAVSASRKRRDTH